MVRIEFALIVFCTVFFSQNIFAQQGEKNNQPSISGKIIDEDEHPLSYVSVALFNAGDSSLVSGTATDNDGQFTIAAKPGNYYLKITFLSFRDKMLSNINPNSEDMDVGKIVLEPDVLAIKEVEVAGERSSMQLQLDKRVFNVGKDLSNTGNNALEVLENVPSVTVDIEGNVSLRGSQNVRVLVDGKPSGLVGIGSTEALRLLQGNMIESIEVITNPSARYDAEGEVGIINIVLKKEREKGVNGSFDLSAGYPHNYSAAYSINYRKKWVNLFSSYSVHYRKSPGKGNTFQQYHLPDTTYAYSSASENTRGGLGNTLRIGSDFFIDDKSALTVSGLFRYSKGNNGSETIYDDLDENGNVIQTTVRNDDEEETKVNWEAAAHYQRELKKKDQKFTADFQWSKSDDTELSGITEENLNTGNIIYQRSSNVENEQNWMFQSDYIHPFKQKGKFETGVKGNFRYIENDYMVEELDNGAGWGTLPGYDDDFTYGENIYAVYAMAGNNIGKFRWQGGLRAEFSDVTTELLNADTVNNRVYFDLFPSAHVSYEFNKSNTLQLSYSRRLSRPSFRWLLPFSGYSDSRNLWSGNPGLDPEYTNSVELGHLKYFEKGSLLSSVYYRYRTGVIERITVVDTSGYSRRMPVNLSTQHALGLEFNMNYDVFKWWRLTGSLNFYRAISHGEYDGEDLDSDTYSWTWRLSSKMTIAKKLDFQTSFNYQGPEETTQGKNKAMYWWDAGLSMDVLKGKGTVTLNGKDILNTRKRRSITDTGEIYSESEHQWRSRQILLSFNYRLNQKKKRSEPREGGFDEGEF